jgi:hypothetical protein
MNQSSEKYWDWQVTALFYSALHLINGHIRETDGGFYNSHSSVQTIIHYSNFESKAKLPREICIAYEKLQLFSRKSRYLFDPHSNINEKPEYIGADGFEKSVYAFDLIYNYLKELYNLNFDKIQVSCLKSGWVNRCVPNVLNKKE